MSSSTRTRRINIYINGKEVSNDIKSISAEMQKLINKNRTLNRESDQYHQNMRQIRSLKGIIAEHNEMLIVTKLNLTSIKGLANAFNKYWPVVMGTIGAIAGLVFSVKSVTDEFAKFDDKIADVMKTTGLTREQVLGLNEEFKKINTRTTQEELLDLAYTAGKLGIATEKEVLGFVRASDMIVVALKKDLGGSAEDAVNALGKLIQVFNLKDEWGIEEAMLKVGSSINELGMASAANEQNIVSFTRRAAGVGKLAGIAVPDMLAVGASMDALAISTEVGATAYIMFMGAMAKKTDVFATIAGMKIEEFTQLLNTDANEAMLRVLESLGRGADGFAGLAEAMGDAGMDGQRAVAVISTLAQQTAFLRDQQELSRNAFDLGTSVIQEFNIKNNTAQAQIEKNTKAIALQRIELGEKLMPVYASGQSGLVKFFKGLVIITEALYNNRAVIASAVAALVFYRTEMAITAIITGTTTRGTLAFAVAQQLNKLVLGASWLAMKLYVVALQMYRRDITIAQGLTLLFNGVLGSTAALINTLLPIFAAVGVAVWTYSKLTQKATEETINLADEIKRLTKEKQESAIKEKVDLETLTTVILGLNEKSAFRVKLINDLKAAYPGLLDHIDAEKISNNDLSEIIKTLNVLTTERISLMAYEAKAEALKNVMIQNGIQQLEVEERRKAKIKDTTKNLTDLRYNQTDIDARIEQINKAADKEYQAYADMNDKFMADYNALIKDMQQQKTNLKAIERAEFVRQRDNVIELINLEKQKAEQDKVKLADLTRELVQLDKKLKIIDQINKAEDMFSETKELEEKLAERERYNKGLVGKHAFEQNIRQIELKYMQGRYENYEHTEENKLELANDIQKKIAEIREANDKLEDKNKGYKLNKDFELNQAKIQLMKDFYEGKIATEKEYNDKLLQLEIDHLQKLLLAEKAGSEEYVQLDMLLQQKLLEQKKEAQRVNDALQDAAANDEIEAENRKYDKKLQDLGLFGVEREQMTELQVKALDAINKEHQANLNEIDAKILKDHLKHLNKTFEKDLAAMKARQTEEYNLVGKDKNKRKELELKHANEQKEFITTFFNEIKALIEKYRTEGALEGVSLADIIVSEDESEVLDEFFTKADEAMAKLKEKFDEIQKLKQKLAGNLGIGSGIDLLGFNIEDWFTFIDLIINKWDEIDFADKFEVIGMGLLALSDATAQYFELLGKFEEREYERSRRKNEEKKTDLGKRLDFGLISQENYNAQVEKMDKEMDRKRAILDRQQAIREKALAIFNATINAAVAVIKVLDKPWLAVAVAAMAAFQIGLIAAAPLPDIPGAEEGGQLVRRAQDGKMFRAKVSPNKRGFVDKPTIITGEAGLEYIVPQEGVLNPTLRPLLDSIEVARINNNLPTANFSRIMAKPIPGRQDGGYASTTNTQHPPANANANANASNLQLETLVLKNTQAIDLLNRKLSQGIRAFVTLYGANGLYQAFEDDQSVKTNSNL